jgi:hypothetical protein
MKKFESLGKSLTKAQQKKITGGGGYICISCPGNNTLCAYCAGSGLGTRYQGIECESGRTYNCPKH